MTLKRPIDRLRLVAIVEGISYLLLAITMPLKYVLQIPQPNYVVGMAHGVLFIAYIILCLQNILIHRWSFKISILILAASLVPFATFYADHKLFRKVASAS